MTPAAVRFGANTDYPICDDCGADIDFEDCFNCGGAGGRDLYEEDPLAYAPDDWEDCEECGGGGILPWCPTHGRVARVAHRPLVVVSSERL